MQARALDMENFRVSVQEGATYVPERKRKIMLLKANMSAGERRHHGGDKPTSTYTRACGNRTFEPYTAPLRMPLTNVSRGAISGFNTRAFSRAYNTSPSRVSN